MKDLIYMTDELCLISDNPEMVFASFDTENAPFMFFASMASLEDYAKENNYNLISKQYIYEKETPYQSPLNRDQD